MNKKIEFLFNYCKKEYKGGIANILESYCSHSTSFNSFGYDIDWINLGLGFSNNKFLATLQKIRYFFVEKRLIFKKIKSIQPDLIHIHTSRGYTIFKDLLIAKYLKRKTKLPIILSIHFGDTNYIFSKNKIVKKKEIKIVNKCIDRVICLSKKTAKELLPHLGANKVTVLYTFHDFEKRDGLLVPHINSPLQIMFMGSIDKRKGIFDLIEAVKKLDFNLSLKIYGGFGNDIQVSESFFKLIDNVKFIEYCGYVAGRDKEKAYSNADVFILPSYGEGMPIVIMEAMAKGCAIISTNVGAIPEIIQDENGIIVEPGDIDSICFAISKINEDRQFLQKMKINNYEKSKNFSISSNIKMLCGIYGELLNNE